jgi:hypothetical protein
MNPIDLVEDSRRRLYVTAAFNVEIAVISDASGLTHALHLRAVVR